MAAGGQHLYSGQILDWCGCAGAYLHNDNPIWIHRLRRADGTASIDLAGGLTEVPDNLPFGETRAYAILYR